MKTQIPKKGRLAIWIKGLGLIFIIALFGVGIYGWYLSEDIDKRFSGRRWSIPSKVYSDSTLLYPGQAVTPDLLFDKIQNLGYRKVFTDPKHKGEFYHKDNSIILFLTDLDLPFQKREGFPIQIIIEDGTIQTLTHVENDDSVPLLELEPEELGFFFGPKREQRRLISLSQVPPAVQKAFLSAEDIRFYQHPGVDFRAILRALYTNLRKGRIHQGGSTITQQLAKNYFLTSQRTFSRKLKEIALALVMEMMYTKDEILEIYLNEIYLGQKGSVAVNGLGEASYLYFGKPANELSLEEGAVIAGLVRAPNLYSPYTNPVRSLNRRNLVLKIMEEQGWISSAEYQTAVSTPLKPAGFQAYGKKAPYFIDYLSYQLETLYPRETLEKLGLSIFTTIDTQVQKAAERALSKGLAAIERRHPVFRQKSPETRIQGAIVVIQPKTGYILAMAGGRDYNLSQFNRITQARRQPGSAFKPFTFLSGLDLFTPATRLSTLPVTYHIDGKDWHPVDFSPVAEEWVSLRAALSRSINTATVDLAMRIGLNTVVQTASNFHFSTPLYAYPSLALGASEVIPLELARAYCPFAADGLLPMPLSLKEVSDENGDILNRRHMKVEQVISPAKAYVMNSLLYSVAGQGTAVSLKNFGITQPVAAKTGTTNDFRDAWFVGYTPDILALVWVGFDDGSPIGETGASAALPIWADLMNRIPQYLSGSWFRKPQGVIERIICEESGEIAVAGRCPHPLTEIFLEELYPTQDCPIHREKGFLKKIFEGAKDIVN